MRTEKPEYDYLILYRLVMLIGMPMVFFDSLLFEGLSPASSSFEVATKYLAAMMVMASFSISWLSRWWRSNIGEITLVISYVVMLNAAAVLCDSRIGNYDSFYAIGTLILIGMSFHKISLLFAFEIPAAALYIVTAFQIPEPLMDPILFTALVIVFSVYSMFFGLSFIRMREKRAESEAVANLWFDQGADGMLYGETTVSTPARVNPAAYKLLGTEDNAVCGELIRNAFFASVTDEDPKTAYERIMKAGSWNNTIEIAAASGHRFWANLDMRRTFIQGKDLTLIRITDVSLQVAHETALQEAKDAAEASVLTRSRFLANMSHEIRNPMNGVIGMTSLLLDTDLSAEQRSYLLTTQASGDALLTLINEILDFSKIDSGEVELDTQEFDLEGCVVDSLDVVAPTAAQKNLELILDFRADYTKNYSGDLNRLRQVLVNLLSNAVKFTDSGLIYLSVSEENGKVFFRLKDTGIGIPESKQPLLFEPFTQADASTTRKYGGTGLGLSICKGIIEKMGGHISVSSRVNHGSVFTFDIKLAQTSNKPDLKIRQLEENLTALLLCAHESSYSILANRLSDLGITPTLTTSSHVYLQEMKSGTYSLIFINADPNLEHHHHEEASQLAGVKRVRLYGVDSRSSNLDYDLIIRRPVSQSELDRGVSSLYSPLAKPSPTAATPSSSEPLALQGKSFLLAEDNGVNQLVAIEMLKKLGITIDVAANGKEALMLIDEGKYDCVFMDVQMPEIDGLEATQLIRQNEKIRQPYIIAMTANAMEEDRQKCLHAGMNDFLSKPLNLATLKQALEAAATSEYLQSKTELH